MKIFQDSAEIAIAIKEDMERLAHTASLSGDEQMRKLAKERVRDIALGEGVFPASIHALYRAFGRGETGGWSVPAMNIRTLTFDTARVLFGLAQELDTNAFVFEIARSEMGYTSQDPEEFTINILAGAVSVGYRGPVFIQGDHYQFKREAFFEDPEAEVAKIEELIQRSITSGFYNIDIDASTLVNLNQAELRDQQKDNYEMTARMTKFIRSIESSGVTVSIGGEIGHIGGKNSTSAEFEAFMGGYREQIGDKMEGISKVSVQTGTHHGGVVSADGTVESVDIDFSVLSDISRLAREKYGMGGTVQHGASTLPDQMFHNFPKNNAVEVHLATGFQNSIYDTMPEDLREKIYSWIRENCSGECEEGMTEEQFIYKLRKKAFGPFKKELWEMSEEAKLKILEELKRKFTFIFEQLGTKGKREVVERYVK